MISTASLPGSLVHTARPGPAPDHARGLLRMVPGSKHQITIKPEGGEPITMHVTAKDRRAFPKATGVLVCLHERCRGKTFRDDAAILAAHDHLAARQHENEAHVYGMWSDDPINAPAADCAKCIGEKGKAPRACADHSGGVIGLLAPAHPGA